MKLNMHTTLIKICFKRYQTLYTLIMWYLYKNVSVSFPDEHNIYCYIRPCHARSSKWIQTAVSTLLLHIFLLGYHFTRTCLLTCATRRFLEIPYATEANFLPGRLILPFSSEDRFLPKQVVPISPQVKKAAALWWSNLFFSLDQWILFQTFKFGWRNYFKTVLPFTWP